MTDFFADLESELLGAARRRATGERARRRLELRPGRLGRRVLALAPILALAGVVAFAAVRLAGPPRDDGRLTGNPPAGTTRVVPEPAVAAVPCQEPSEPASAATPSAVRRALAVLRRAQTPIDALPGYARPDGGSRLEWDLSWLPVTSFRSGDVRRPGADRPREVYVVPSAGVQTDEACGGEGRRSEADQGPGACLLLDAPRFRVACFTLEQIRAGRAVALVPGDAQPPTLVGLAPDGVERVMVDAGGGPELAGVIENLYAVTVPGARAGGSLDVAMLRAGELAPPERAECSRPAAPLRGTRQRVPESLRDFIPPGLPVRLPPQAEASIRDLDAERVYLDGIRAVRVGEGIILHVVPVSGAVGHLRCVPGGPEAAPPFPEEICLVAVRDGRALGSACLNPVAAREGAWDFASFAGRQLLLGVAPRTKQPPPAGELILSGTGTGVAFGIHGGVFAAVLPEGVSERRARESVVQFAQGRYLISVVDASGGTVPARELDEVRRAAGGVDVLEVAGRPELATGRSRVLYRPGARERASALAQRLRIADVRPLAGDPAARIAAPAVVVVLGEDRLP